MRSLQQFKNKLLAAQADSRLTLHVVRLLLAVTGRSEAGKFLEGKCFRGRMNANCHTCCRSYGGTKFVTLFFVILYRLAEE